MEAKVLFKKALEQATATIKCVEARHFKNPTPCTEWDCHTLVNHMLYELSWVPDLLAGKTVTDVGKKYEGDLMGKDHIKNWLQAADKATEAVNHAELKQTIHLSYADVPAEHYINEIGGDLLIHSWDVDQSLKCSLVIDPDLAKAIYNNIYPRHREYKNSGLFGKPFEVDKDARMQTKLLALVGRHEP